MKLKQIIILIAYILAEYNKKLQITKGRCVFKYLCTGLAQRSERKCASFSTILMLLYCANKYLFVTKIENSVYVLGPCTGLKSRPRPGPARKHDLRPRPGPGPQQFCRPGPDPARKFNYKSRARPATSMSRPGPACKTISYLRPRPGPSPWTPGRAIGLTT